MLNNGFKVLLKFNFKKSKSCMMYFTIYDVTCKY